MPKRTWLALFYTPERTAEAAGSGEIFESSSLAVVSAFDSLTVHSLDYQGLREIFALSDSEGDSASGHVQHLPARLEAWLPRWSEQLSNPLRVSYPGYVKLPGDNTLGITA